MIRRIRHFLGSLRLTLAIIIALTLLLLAGLVIPQKGVLQKDLYLQWRSSHPELVAVLDSIGLTDIYRSPLAVVLWSAFFINLSVVMWGRIRAVRQQIALHPDKLQPPSRISSGAAVVEVRLPDALSIARVAELLVRRSFDVLTGHNRLYAIRNRRSPVATIIFHLSFLMILIGGLTTIATRFTARVELAEGESFDGELSRYMAPPRLPRIGDPPRPSFLVERIAPQLVDGQPVGIKVTIRDQDDQVDIAEINRPFRSDGCSFVIQDIGVAPLIIISDSNGTQLDGAWVKLDVLLGKQDRFEMAGLDLGVSFFPDLVITDGSPATRSQEVNNPAFVFQHAGETSDPLGLGEGLVLDGLRLTPQDLRYWVRFYVRKESGLAVVWTGFALAAIALVWRLLLYRREYWGTISEPADGGRLLVLRGRAEFYRDLFIEELSALAEELQRELAGNDVGAEVDVEDVV
jgi:cytochrome c biogenesis protein ResB